MDNQTIMSLLFLAALIVLMYFTLIRPQKKKEKETNAMRDNLMVGDEIVTIGGFLGKIVKTKEESVVIQCGADKTKLEVMRWGISKVLEEGDGRAAVDSVFEDDEPVKKPSRPKRMKKAEVPAEEIVEETETAEEVVEEKKGVIIDGEEKADL